jgi:1-deoxy-D-xylulose-5-phosphate reductoisomerase
MRLPISLALAWPDRLPAAAAPVDWSQSHSWTFAPVDQGAFPLLGLAVEAGRAGGVAPAVYNAANEVCVEAFLAGGLRYLGIIDTVAAVLREPDVPSVQSDLSVGDVLEADRWARQRARRLVESAAAPGGALST